MNANLAFIPTRVGLYETSGVDFLYDAEVATGRETQGNAQFVQWTETEAFDLDNAEDAINASGFRIVGGLAGLDYTASDDYAVATLEAL